MGCRPGGSCSEMPEVHSRKCPGRFQDENVLLATLGDAGRGLMNSEAERIDLKPKQVIHRRNTPLKYAYFPCGALISVAMPSNARFVEIAMIGSEGFFGLPLLFGTDSCPMSALSHVAGPCVRLRAHDFQHLLVTDSTFAVALNRYAQAYSVMVAQAAACNAAHRLEQRCAKWLLMTHDRLRVDQFPVTQQFLAEMLGVRRPTVSAVAGQMQQNKLIRYRQGQMTILSRRGLEELSCGCYEIIRAEFDRMRHTGERRQRSHAAV